jgi:hypothetical protein
MRNPRIANRISTKPKDSRVSINLAEGVNSTSNYTLSKNRLEIIIIYRNLKER